MHILIQVVITIAVLVLARLVINRLVKTIVRHAVRPSRYETTDDELKRENTLINIFRTAITVIIALIGVILILKEVGVNVAALATGAGLVGVLVGFGAQNAVRDYLAGIFIIIENQYRVGDIVAVSGGNVGATGKSGVVEDISIRITKLRDLDGNLHIIRNGEPSIISNLSINFANVNVDLNVAYDTDIEKVEEVVNRVGEKQAKDETWKRHITEPIQFLRIDQFTDAGITVKCLGKVRPAHQWDIAGDFRRRIMEAFRTEGIEMVPLSQLVVHTAKPAAAKKHAA